MVDMLYDLDDLWKHYDLLYHTLYYFVLDLHFGMMALGFMDYCLTLDLHYLILDWTADLDLSADLFDALVSQIAVDLLGDLFDLFATDLIIKRNFFADLDLFYLLDDISDYSFLTN